jgi:hypothetical protein
MIGADRDEHLTKVFDAELDEYVWARSLNPNPVRDSIRDAGRRLLSRISGTSFRAPVEEDIAAKRRRERAAKGIITVGGL